MALYVYIFLFYNINQHGRKKSKSIRYIAQYHIIRIKINPFKFSIDRYHQLITIDKRHCVLKSIVPFDWTLFELPLITLTIICFDKIVLKECKN